MILSPYLNATISAVMKKNENKITATSAACASTKNAARITRIDVNTPIEKTPIK
jgi:hypothetical protein